MAQAEPPIDLSNNPTSSKSDRMYPASRRPWTPADDARLLLLSEQMPILRVARELGRTRVSVYSRLARLRRGS